MRSGRPGAASQSHKAPRAGGSEQQGVPLLSTPEAGSLRFWSRPAAWDSTAPVTARVLPVDALLSSPCQDPSPVGSQHTCAGLLSKGGHVLRFWEGRGFRRTLHGAQGSGSPELDTRTRCLTRLLWGGGCPARVFGNAEVPEGVQRGAGLVSTGEKVNSRGPGSQVARTQGLGEALSLPFLLLLSRGHHCLGSGARLALWPGHWTTHSLWGGVVTRPPHSGAKDFCCFSRSVAVK